jgi:hypothetical protein
MAMTNQQLCYWLMGYFELREDKEHVLTPQQRHTIRQHLEQTELSRQGSFARTLREILDGVDGGYPIDRGLMRALVRSLQQEFLTVIDPSYGPGLEKRLEIHEPEPERRRPLAT